MDLSVIVVNYNTRDLLNQLLASIYRYKVKCNFEVIVVDNGSKDGSSEMVHRNFSQVRLITNFTNLGFAGANNQGIRNCTGRYVLLLNSDTIVFQDTLDTMVDFLDSNPEVGAAGCKVVLPDGKLDLACRRSFPTPLNSLHHALGLAKLFPRSPRFAKYNLSYLDEDESYPVDSLVGAFMMVRREVIDQVGLLDESFFMYGEDIDWCYRIKQAGWEIYYYPKTSIIHYKGASSRKVKTRMIYEFHRAMVIFYQKHYASKNNFLVNWLVLVGIWTRYLVALIANAFKRKGERAFDQELSKGAQPNTGSR